MASGSKRKRGDDEYIFIDGKALRAGEVVRIDVETSVPGQAEAKKAGEHSGKTSNSQALHDMTQDDALELTEEAKSGSLSMLPHYMAEERRIVRRKCLAFGLVLLVVTLASLCINAQKPGQFIGLAETFAGIGEFVRLTFIQIFQQASYQTEYREVIAALPTYPNTVLQLQLVVRFLVCGAMLAVSGMLYQNAFKNPIAAPSMLGVSSGIDVALLVLTLQLGYEAFEHIGLYYLYAIVGGLLLLVLVILGGKWISGPGRFNTVNMILMGTIVAQLVNVVVQYAQTYLLDDQAWQAYYMLQNATGLSGLWVFATLAIGAVAAFVPIFMFRFRLNLVSFSDAETKILGVDPSKLRVLALVCGSIMILAAQLNIGQVAMISLVVPFLTRQVFGSEFRKQLTGNILIGALLLLVFGSVSEIVVFDGSSISLSAAVSILIIPLFVWVMSVRQKAWE